MGRGEALGRPDYGCVGVEEDAGEFARGEVAVGLVVAEGQGAVGRNGEVEVVQDVEENYGAGGSWADAEGGLHTGCEAGEGS